MANLMLEGNSLVLQCRYDPGLVAEIKALPYTERRYDPARKAWVVDPRHGKRLAEIVTAYLGEMVFVPDLRTTQESILKTLEVRYLGATKERESSDERSAFGYCNQSWSVIFPESVLINWFTGLNSMPETALTYYGMLGLSRGANSEDIKTAFRRLARQWHPDVCREPNAAEQFMAIKNAFDVLSDPNLRARYNAGLALEASLKRESKPITNAISNYRAPLRCGHILAEGMQGLYFTVSKILAWEDIYDAQGRVLVTSWPRGAKIFEEGWY